MFGLVDHAFQFAKDQFHVAQTVLSAVCVFSSRDPRIAADLQKNGKSALHGSSSELGFLRSTLTNLSGRGSL